jgi:hypothetical protein
MAGSVNDAGPNDTSADTAQDVPTDVSDLDTGPLFDIQIDVLDGAD